MGGLLFIALVISALAAFGALAILVGVDSRPGFPDDRAGVRGITV